MPLVKQEIFCHGCDSYVQFEIDINVDGNYTIPCPKCGHEHYRVVRNRMVTDQRWASSGPAIYVNWATVSTSSMDIPMAMTVSTSTATGQFYFNADGTYYSGAY